MKKCFRNNELENCVTEIFETFVGFCIALRSFIEDTAVDAGEDVEINIFRENLERGEEFTHFRFKLSAIITKGCACHEGELEVKHVYYGVF